MSRLFIEYILFKFLFKKGPGSRSHIYDSPKKNIYDSPEGGSHVVLDPFAIKMHKLSKSISRPTQELEIDDIDFDRKKNDFFH